MTNYLAIQQRKNNLESLIKIAENTSSTTNLIKTYINTTPMLYTTAKASQCSKPTTLIWVVALNLLSSPMTKELARKVLVAITHIEHLIQETYRLHPYIEYIAPRMKTPGKYTPISNDMKYYAYTKGPNRHQTPDNCKINQIS